MKIHLARLCAIAHNVVFREQSEQPHHVVGTAVRRSQCTSEPDLWVDIYSPKAFQALPQSFGRYPIHVRLGVLHA